MHLISIRWLEEVQCLFSLSTSLSLSLTLYVLFCRESRTEEEEAAECSPVSPVDEAPAGIENINSRLMASILSRKAGLDLQGQSTSWKVLPL